MTSFPPDLLDMGENDVVLYTRMSMLKEEGIERQRDETIPYLEKQGFAIVKEFSDNKKSATKDNVKRDDFEKILELAKARRQRHGDHVWTKVGCWHSDRFARRVKDILRVAEAGILVHGKNSGHFDLSTPAGVATAVTVTAWAEYEGKQKALRQKAAHFQRAQSGKPWWMNRPFGFEMDGTHHAVEGPIVRGLYKRLLAGSSLTGLAAWLNSEGVSTTKGNTWRGTTLRNVLMNARNAGILLYDGEEMGQGNWEGLVSEDIYRAAVRLLSEPTRLSPGPRDGRGGRTSIMTGFATCKVCDLTARTKAPRGYRLYGCPDGHASARADWVDARAAALIVTRLEQPDVISRLGGSENAEGRAKQLREELERLGRKGDEIEEMYDQEEITRPQMKSLNQKNLARITEVRRELSSIGLDDALRSLLEVEDIADHWDRVMDVFQKHAVVTKFFDRIVIHPRGKANAGQMSSGDVEFWVKGYSEPMY